MTEIKERYEHEHEPSVFVMLTHKYEWMWCTSGNVLRDIYLESPGEFLSGPLELSVPQEVYDKISYMMDNY